MCKIIGQTKLMTTLNNYTLENFPKTILLIGQAGCGKHTIAKYIANKFEFDFIEIDEKVDSEDLFNFSHKTINTLYLVNLNNFEEKQQNQFLKFIEEPSKTVYTVLIADSEVGILNTIKNRCTRLYFDRYTKEELQEITHSCSVTDDLAYEIFQTPGKLNSLTNESFKQLYELAEKIVDKINLASYGNTMLISTKLNYKDSFDKIDPEMFLETIEYIAFNKFKQGDRNSFRIFSITNQFKQHMNKKALIKETLILNYLTALWEATRYQ